MLKGLKLLFVMRYQYDRKNKSYTVKPCISLGILLATATLHCTSQSNSVVSNHIIYIKEFESHPLPAARQIMHKNDATLMPVFSYMFREELAIYPGQVSHGKRVGLSMGRVRAIEWCLEMKKTDIIFPSLFLGKG